MSDTDEEQTQGKAKEQPVLASALSQKERETIAKLPYEQARDQLIQAVQALEAGGLDLDASMRQWEIGEALAKRAQELLGQVRARLDAAQQEQASAGAQAGTQSNMEG
ncbi:exodeoxyribonuclease VII small subunit [Bifidobacterium sp. B4001]|uniref:exodeoxyribonuclease VII small subunit n=1 Tax=unclassified Bifidobacterium TaxID=2608897 RepID=UPI00226BA7E8|nr:MULTISPECIES: exodeoxyribonuclease VII small subunit [unclassified Bifidobacterium]MCX8672664.1 exodeoxyribonuclease VII small subunit [Bifidobacterium sp. B4079]MCX8681097.1 exodeoxyribonuclease VII small subunit [Bifidobacterium sp. B4001]